MDIRNNIRIGISKFLIQFMLDNEEVVFDSVFTIRQILSQVKDEKRKIVDTDKEPIKTMYTIMINDIKTKNFSIEQKYTEEDFAKTIQPYTDFNNSVNNYLRPPPATTTPALEGETLEGRENT